MNDDRALSHDERHGRYAAATDGAQAAEATMPRPLNGRSKGDVTADVAKRAVSKKARV